MKPKELVVEPCALTEVKAFIESNHYSRSVNGVKIHQCFSVKHGGVLVGAVLYGAMSTTAWKRFGTLETEVVELRRLVLTDGAPKYSESRVVSLTIKWLKKHAKDLKIIVSYADPAHGHTGVVYKASNFNYVGVSAADKGFFDPETQKTYHSRALRTKYKGEYKPFVERLRHKLAAGVLVPVSLPGKHCFIYKLSK